MDNYYLIMRFQYSSGLLSHQFHPNWFDSLLLMSKEILL